MNDQTNSGSSAVWGVLAVVVIIIAIAGGSVYLISDRVAAGNQARAAQAQAEAQKEQAWAYAQTQIAQAQVELARAHEEGSTERMQVFALTLKAFSNDNQLVLTMLATGVLLFAILQLVQYLTRPRGGA